MVNSINNSNDKHRAITQRDDIILRNFSSLIAECLGCIDISMPDPQIDDKFSQKKTTKRQIEKAIYDVRNTFLAIDNPNLILIIDTRMAELEDKCREICFLAFANEEIAKRVVNKMSSGIHNAKDCIVEEINNL